MASTTHGDAGRDWTDTRAEITRAKRDLQRRPNIRADLPEIQEGCIDRAVGEKMHSAADVIVPKAHLIRSTCFLSFQLCYTLNLKT